MRKLGWLETVNKKFVQFIKQFGWSGLVRLLVYPLTVLFTTPVRLAQTLWASRVLADGRWGHYSHFAARPGLVALFYWTRALNLYRFGRNGCSPYLGLGDYSLSRGFMYSLPSLYAYWLAGAVVPLAGLFGWWLFHLVWVNQASPTWVLLIMCLSLISTTFYANTFRLQNYNALGWLFFPLGLYGLATGQWLTVGLAWLAVSFGSFTVVFLAGFLSLVVAVENWSLAPLLAILPAGLKLATHFWPFLVQGQARQTLLGVMKAIGLSRVNVKYKRIFPKKVLLKHSYFFALYLQFLLATYLLTGTLSNLFIGGLIIFLLNSTYVRFADEQSIFMLMISLANVVMMQQSNPWLLPSYWLLISPLPRAIVVGFRGGLDVAPKFRPFFIKNLLGGVETFLAVVRPGERVLMAFDHPNGVYGNIFDGYRLLVELPLYVAARREIHFMPDWWGVFELNYEGAPEFWGRDVASVQKNAEYWQADYVAVYQVAQAELDPKWQNAGFEVMGRFAWADYAEDLRGEKICEGPLPDWWLLKKPGGYKKSANAFIGSETVASFSSNA